MHPYTSYKLLGLGIRQSRRSTRGAESRDQSMCMVGIVDARSERKRMKAGGDQNTRQTSTYSCSRSIDESTRATWSRASTHLGILEIDLLPNRTLSHKATTIIGIKCFLPFSSSSALWFPPLDNGLGSTRLRHCRCTYIFRFNWKCFGRPWHTLVHASAFR